MRVSPAVRERVRLRARSRCEYCDKPADSGYYPDHIDHVIPPMHLGNDDESNLAFSCFRCNVSKDTNVASYDTETGVLTPLFNPRKDKWNDHFEMDGAVIIGKTAIGRVTIRILQMDHPSQITTRRELMDADEW